MIGLRVSVPIACWRKGHAREYLETESLPPPATCYGSLLSFVGETDARRHHGARVSAGIAVAPSKSVVLRTLWQIKDRKRPQGNGQNAGPDFQELLTNAELLLWLDSSLERGDGPSLAERVVSAFTNPASLERFGGWSLGESTHLVNDATLIAAEAEPGASRSFLVDPDGDLTLPVVVDHVGAAGTVYATGKLVSCESWPEARRLPVIGGR
ncbi:MAG: type I-MYXAN CRISPR-associated protein Cas5/Cmx5/DevS [Thermoanaerobaculia bacterium]|nr:type I-MYXAN CRISPR-associated protein Cas5/Cmx5/DevS [Thermoanaerobaculia bacterium]